MSDTSVSAAIVRHIEEIEVALRHLETVMGPRLEREAGIIIEAKRKSFGWAGEVDHTLDPDSWLAAKQWRTAGDTDDSFDLYINFEGSNCVDDSAPETWVAQFVGFGGSGMRFSFHTNALGKTEWKALLRSEAVIENLVMGGFVCDPRKGLLTLPVRIGKDALVSAFEEQDFDEALGPIGAALDRIKAARSMLDRLVAAIRAF